MPENRDSASNQRIAFTATAPIYFPKSLNATAAVPFSKVRCLAWMAKFSRKPSAQNMDAGFEIRSDSKVDTPAFLPAER
jgi:hypothetical protein